MSQQAEAEATGRAAVTQQAATSPMRHQAEPETTGNGNGAVTQQPDPSPASEASTSQTADSPTPSSSRPQEGSGTSEAASVEQESASAVSLEDLEGVQDGESAAEAFSSTQAAEPPCDATEAPSSAPASEQERPGGSTEGQRQETAAAAAAVGLERSQEESLAAVLPEEGAQLSQQGAESGGESKPAAELGPWEDVLVTVCAHFLHNTLVLQNTSRA